MAPEEGSLTPLDAASLLHDLRQPLSNIEAYTYLLRRVLDGVEDTRIAESLDSIDRQTAEIGRILLTALGKPAQAESRRFTNPDSAALT